MVVDTNLILSLIRKSYAAIDADKPEVAQEYLLDVLTILEKARYG